MTAAPAAPAASVTLDVEGLSFAYPEGGHRLRSVSLSLGPGEVCCLLGPNGAGKTTLLRCVVGLLTPEAGSIRVLGTAVGAMTSRELSRRVAYVPQASSTPFPFTALDIAVMGRTPHIGVTSAPSAGDRRIAMDCLHQLGIGHLASALTSNLCALRTG
ncbi:MAG: ABC transporter ATP-binding protein, partial [Actinomycetota bacterium]